MIGLGLIPNPGKGDFRQDRIGIEFLFRHGRNDLLSNFHLLRRMVENCRTVLSPDIVPLPIEGCRIVDDK